MIENSCKSSDFCSKQHFQYLKGIAILAVVFSHVGNYSGKTWFTPFGGIGVAIFLFCSGYGLMISYRNKGLSTFWKNKFISVYLPFAFVEIVTAVILQRSLSDVILDLFFIKCLNPLGWYMQYLVMCYFIFWIGIKYIQKKNIRVILWSVIAVGSFFLFDNLRAEQALSFLSGVFLAEYRNAKKEDRNNAKFTGGGYGTSQRRYLFTGYSLVCMAIILLAIKQLPIVRMQNHYLVTLLNLVMKLSCTVGCLLITRDIRPLKKIVLWFGGLSYSLYLIHGYFMCFMAKNIFGSYVVNSFVMITLSVASAILLNEMNKTYMKKIIARGK